MSTIGNITEEAIKRYIYEQEGESKKEDSKKSLFKGMLVIMFAIPAF